jgi:ParB/RepB/Spo0J family partition protein
MQEGGMMEPIEILLDRIDANPWQPRETEDKEHIKKIALSIAQDGLMQVPVGRWVFPDGTPVHGMGRADLTGSGLRVQLAFGHSRLAAFWWLEELKGKSNLVGDWSHMPVLVREITDEEMFRLAVGENLARKDLTPVEEARAMLRYRDDFGKTSAEIGALFGLAESSVRNKLRLLGLPADLQTALAEGRLSEGAGRALLSLFELPERIVEIERKKNVMLPSGHRGSIADQALAGNTAETLAGMITSLVRQEGRDLGAAKWKFDDRVDSSRDENIRCELCRECDYLVRREKQNFCADRACYDARMRLWKVDRLAEASAACGIAPTEDLSKSVYEYSQIEGAIIETARRGGCENLRLVYNPMPRYGETDRMVPGFPDVMILCAKRAGYCTCEKGFEAMRQANLARIQREKNQAYEDSQTRLEVRETILEDAPTADDLREAARARRQKEKQDKIEVEAIRADFCKRLAQAFLDRNRKVMMKLFGSAFYSMNSETRAEYEKGDPFLIVLAAAEAATRQNYYGDAPDPKREMDRANAFLKEAGLAEMESGL